MYILAVFRSRAQALDYSSRLIKYGIQNITMSAPKQTKIGCGLCVKLDYSNFIMAKNILRYVGYSSFYGFFKGNEFNGNNIIYPI